MQENKTTSGLDYSYDKDTGLLTTFENGINGVKKTQYATNDVTIKSWIFI